MPLYVVCSLCGCNLGGKGAHDGHGVQASALYYDSLNYAYFIRRSTTCRSPAFLPVCHPQVTCRSPVCHLHVSSACHLPVTCLSPACYLHIIYMYMPCLNLVLCAWLLKGTQLFICTTQVIKERKEVLASMVSTLSSTCLSGMNVYMCSIVDSFFSS